MKKIAVIALSISALGIASCQKKGCTDELASNYEEKAKKDDGTCEYSDGSVTVNFDHVVGADDLVFTNKSYYSAVGHEYSIETVKYIVSRITAHGDDGDVEIFDGSEGFLYVDAEDATTLAHSGGTLPVGTYVGITFTFGLDNTDNTNDAFTTLPETNMEWPDVMGGGFHFMKLEGYYDSLDANGTLRPYNTHIGTIDGMGMSQENSWSVTFNTSFVVASSESVGINIQMDLQEWYETPNTYDFLSWDDGVMMEMMAQTQLRENGEAGVFTVTVD